MKYKLICSDLDDTLIDENGKFGKGLKEAIHDYEKRGGKFRIVTGRMTPGVMSACKELELKGEVVTFQGAVISDIETGKVYTKNVIPWEKAVEIGKFIEETGAYYQAYNNINFISQKVQDFTHIYSTLTNADFLATGIKLSEYIEKEKLNSPKLLIMEKPEKVPSFMNALREKYGNEFLINTSKPFIIEIIPKSVNKGLAVKTLAEKYCIKREEVICIGDSENDLTMIEYAGLGVCVGTGSEILKKSADVIAPGLNDDPVTWVIKNYSY